MTDRPETPETPLQATTPVRFALKWSLATGLGCALGIPLLVLIAGDADIQFDFFVGTLSYSADYLPRTAGFLAYGVVLGACQWGVALRGRLPHAGLWVAATGIGMPAGLATAELITHVMRFWIVRDQLAALPPDWYVTGPANLLGDLLPVSLGAVVFQWLFLHLAVHRAWQWLVLKPLVWVATMAAMLPALPIMVLAGAAMAGAGSWAMVLTEYLVFILPYGALTGALLSTLLGRTREQADLRQQGRALAWRGALALAVLVAGWAVPALLRSPFAVPAEPGAAVSGMSPTPAPPLTALGTPMPPHPRRIALDDIPNLVSLAHWEAQTSLGWEPWLYAGQVMDMSWSPAGDRLAAARGGSVAVYDIAAGTVLYGRQLPGDALTVAFSPDGASLATGSYDGLVQAWSTRDNSLMATLAGHEGPVWSVAYSPDGTKLASISFADIRVWQMADGEELYHFPLATDTRLDRNAWAGSLEFAADGQSLVALCSWWQRQTGDLYRRQTVRIWRMSDGQMVREWNPLEGQTSRCPSTCQLQAYSLALSPDGQLVAVGGEDNHAWVWRATDGTLVQSLQTPGTSEYRGSVAFGPDGSFLAAGGGQSPSIVFWRLSDGRPLRRVEFYHHWSVASHSSLVAFSPDGTLLASSSPSGIDLWGVAP